MKKSVLFTPAIILVTFLVAIAATTIDDFFLPGSQVGQSGNIETPDRCDNCHGGYDAAVEPAFNWRGSMMAQAARDPLFYACLAIANQDAPEVGDLCLRCHTPDGWLNGRCEPTDGSLLNNNDRQGVQCDFCHKLVKPALVGANPYPNDPDYNQSVYGTVTHSQDQAYLGKLTHIPNGSANGMYIADDNNAKRGPFTNATGRHQMTYSPFHKEAALCGTCHDVSNPAFTRASITDTEYSYNTEGMMSETFDLRLMFPVERTYSEWLASSYNSSANGKTCQDCHMKDVTGKGAKMKDAPLRSDLPLHDFTGGNTFVPLMVKDKWAAEVNAAALDAGIERSRQQLKAAADVIVDVTTQPTSISSGSATVKIINKTGHKLPTGYPEGRRMWINVKFYNSSNALIGESGKYDPATAELTKTGTTIYECKPGFSAKWATTLGKPAAPSFNFAINNFVWFDNRIPPAGSTYDGLLANQSPFVDEGGIPRTGNSTTDIHTDLTPYAVPANTAKIEVRLMYQTTSKEYVEFLRDENRTNNAGQELYGLWVKHGKSAPEIMNEIILHIGTPPPPALTYLDASFVLVTKKTSKKQATGYAEVKVVKAGTTTPIAGATVYADYTGPSSGSTSAITDINGIARLSSKAVTNPLVPWCFRVLDVVKPADTASPGGYEYIVPKPLAGACDPYPATTALKNALIPDGTIFETSLTVYPNPSNGRAWLGYTLAEPGQTRLAVYNSTGQQVTILTDMHLDAGEHTAIWDGAGFPNGVYYFRLASNNEVITRPLILNK
jgi:hypothetical protein